MLPLSRAPWLASIWLVLTCAVWLPPHSARADCGAPTPQVLWSYPAAGQQDVPTNATLWLRLSRVGNITLTLNGAPQQYVAVDALSPDEPGRILQIEPSALQPNTDYSLRVGYDEPREPPASDGGWSSEERPASDDAGIPAPPGTVLEVAFRTGAQPVAQGAATSAQLEATSVDLFGVDERVAQHPCRPLIEAQGCFDTGLRKSLTLTVQAEQALAFLVLGPGAEDAQLWPARCGAPLLYMRGEITDIFGIIGLSPQCYEVRALQPGGVVSESVSFCTDTSELGSADAGAPPLDAGVDAVADAAVVGETDAASEADSATPQSKRDDDGCSVGSRHASQPAPPWSAVLLFAIALLVRRAARRRRVCVSAAR